MQNIVSFIGLFAKETYNFKEPTNRSHSIAVLRACSGAVFFMRPQHPLGSLAFFGVGVSDTELHALHGQTKTSSYFVKVWGGYD